MYRGGLVLEDGRMQTQALTVEGDAKIRKAFARKERKLLHQIARERRGKLRYGVRVLQNVRFDVLILLTRGARVVLAQGHQDAK